MFPFFDFLSIGSSSCNQLTYIKFIQVKAFKYLFNIIIQLSLNQSLNQFLNQSVNQSLNQISEPISKKISELLYEPICPELMLRSTNIYLSKLAKCSYESIYVHTFHDFATQLSTMLTHLSLYYHEVFINTTNHQMSYVSTGLL